MTTAKIQRNLSSQIMLNKLLTKPSILYAKRLEKVINISYYSIKPEKQSGKIKKDNLHGIKF